MFRSSFALASLVASALAAACGLEPEEDANDCPRGTEDCRCKSDDSCNAGLFCDEDKHCSAAGGSAGKGGAGGGSAGTAGKAGSSSSGGTSGRAGSGGSGGSGGPAGAAGRSGSGGEPGSGGSSGAADAGETSEPGGGEGGRADGDGGMSGEGGGDAGRGGSSGGAGSGGSAGTAGSAGNAGSGGSSGARACVPFTVADPPTPNIQGSSTAVYAYPATVPAPISEMGTFNLEFFSGAAFDGELTGTFTIGAGADANYRSCSRCLRVTIDDTRHFIGSAGTLTLDADSDQLNGTVYGSISDATLVEVTIDPNSFESTPVAGGDCLTLDALALDIEPENPPPEAWTCPDFWYADGECDCGCGARDLDCEDASFGSCVYCWCGETSGSNCDAPDPGVDPTDNSQCL